MPKSLEAICKEARDYIKSEDLYLSFSPNKIKDYATLERAAKEVESRNNLNNSRPHAKLYALLLQAEAYQ